MYNFYEDIMYNVTNYLYGIVEWELTRYIMNFTDIKFYKFIKRMGLIRLFIKLFNWKDYEIVHNFKENQITINEISKYGKKKKAIIGIEVNEDNNIFIKVIPF